MKDFPVIVSFYTKNTPYEEEVKNLIQSCARFGLETQIEGVDSFGSWELNCAFKPFFLYQKLQELKKDLLWVDADAVFLQKPVSLDVFAADLAVRIHDELPDHHPSKVISSTIYVSYTEKAQELLRKWAQECTKQLMRQDRKEEFWDQIALRDVLFSKKTLAKVGSLPRTHTKIAGHPQDEKEVPEAVIEHYQASRRFKNFL
jgi:hypothetical protein